MGRNDIRPSPALKACLAARSYRREVILLTETRLNPVYQTFRMLLSLGYEHVVLLSLPDRCARSNELWPRLSCVWSSQQLASNTKYLLDRVAFLARAARLGYGVFMLDSDVLLFHDPYVHLWAPPLANLTLVAMLDAIGWLNCRVVYVRNARPDGPVAYMLAEVVDRLERWRPLSYGCWHPGELAARLLWEEAHHRALRTGGTGGINANHYMQLEDVPWPSHLLAGARNWSHAKAQVFTGLLRVPNTRGEWPEDLGGQFYPPTRGPNSQQWMDILREDVLPLWPDPEDPLQADAGANISERIGYLPHYLAERYTDGGALGYWNPALARTTGHAPVVLAHFVHVPGGATNKLTVKMASNNWDWDVAHAVHPKRGVFFASTHIVPVPDVLGYSQAVLDRDWATEQEFASAAMALLRVATETGRAVSWPALRCNVSWLGGAANNQLPLRMPHRHVIPYATADKGIADLRCLWVGYLQYGCQAWRWHFAGGLLAPEYDHLLLLLRRNGSAVDAAGAANLNALGLRQPTTDTVGDATTHPSIIDGSSNEVAEVPPELLRPPASAAAWDVETLGTALMARHGGPGAGMQVLLQPGSEAALTMGVPVTVAAAVSGAIAAAKASAAAVAVAAATAAAGGGAAGPLRPQVLLLSEVPVLMERLGPRHELFKAMVSGPDRSTTSCEWVATGRPYRRARTRRQRRRAAR
ncbi:hypothetical protein TSOC_002066 [Tetrabaena socialis]|uniref:Nucleotide-diphospho-sugar transferase domain-containing protein n=1 Tax=Tetrabaena socialis TaxID=47790 RepID=A0A2J8AF38_9CHLO|nr:hypothetical protein TSOC_002066 [Tetrabaena socialis]|eukprot:PNH11138.1 hypothetical protein TSOC_002066 [Tetrabaena socialis]